jgi:NSS family neurotransmitter:Na+ symporter
MGPMSGFLLFGKNFFDLLDYITANILLPLGGLMMLIFIGYFWGVDKAAEEIEQGGKFQFKLKGFWNIMVKFVGPIAVGVVFLNMLGIIKF